MKKKQLLKEIMGVPKAIDFWVENFSIILAGMAKGIADAEEIEEAEGNITNEKGEEVKLTVYRGQAQMGGKNFNDWLFKLTGHDLKTLLKDERFKQFPLFKPNIELTVMFMPQEVFDIEERMRGHKPDFIEASHAYDASEKLLEKLGGDNFVFTKQNFTFSVSLPTEMLHNFNTEEFRKAIKPTISHELNHAYESYSRLKGSGDPTQRRESYLNMTINLMKDDKYPQWGNFLHIMYLHLSTELNARITQFYYQAQDKGISNYDDFMVELKNSHVWNEIERLKNFDARQFMNSFTVGKMGFKEMLADVGVQMNRAIKGLPPIQAKKTPEEGMKHLIQGWNGVLQFLNQRLQAEGFPYKDLMAAVPEKAMKDPYYFFKFFEDRFHKKADKFTKKVHRLASLLQDENTTWRKENEHMRESIKEIKILSL